MGISLQGLWTDSGRPHPRRELWEAIERLVDRMDVSSLLAHGLAPLAAARWTEVGRTVPERVRAELRVAEATTLLAMPVLERARAAYPGRMLVIKGPEIAARYPLRLRWFGDLDVLVDDGPAAFGALIGAGFEPIEVGKEETRAHHFPPIWWPGMHLPIEIHTGLNWPRLLTAPPIDEIFATAVRSTLPVDGLETAAPAQHALLTAAHGWRHVPLRSVRDLLDVRLLADEADAAELERVARRWNLTRIWRTTDAAAAWLFEGGKRPFATRVWAQSLREPRQTTVLEWHLRRWITPFWAVPLHRAVAAAGKSIYADLQPVDSEGWAAKLRRSAGVGLHPRRTRLVRPGDVDDV